MPAEKPPSVPVEGACLERAATAEIKVYGSALSYYTGKLEAYLRYKGIPYRFLTLSPALVRRLARETGTSQIPAVELPDGRLMTDTTPMIEWFEASHPGPAVIPADPLQAFFSRLVEDYAEEWLWRPAMHFRWSYAADAMLQSRRLADEIMHGVPLPAFSKRFFMRRRQHGFYVERDGVSAATWDHVEGIYLATLERLEAIFANRPFLLGRAPTLADFGFFASMFRHFSQDPTPAEIMRRRAPGVFAWQARVWNARARTHGAIAAADGRSSEAEARDARALEPGIPDDWGPLLDDLGRAYLPYLCANAEAWKAGLRRHDVDIEGVPYRRLPVSQYRVWCLERLRAHFEALPADVRAPSRALLERHGCWEPFWRVEHPDSRYDLEGRVPFRGRAVHYDNAR